MLPSKESIELPLLRAIQQLGGKARSRDTYPLVTAHFDLSEEEATRILASGSNAWTNRIQWTRLSLVTKGEIDNSTHGIWAITDKGLRRLEGSMEALGGESSEVCPSQEGLEEIFDRYQDAFRDHLLGKLLDLSPGQFEAFAKQLLVAYGFVEVEVTQVSQDGGIDGHGRLKVGLATMGVAFQCKRWQGAVGRPEIDKFRGAIQGAYEQGLFFTTSAFTTGAKDASIKKGAVPVILLDGASIVDLMMDRGFGVERRPLELYYDRLDSVFSEDQTRS